MVSLIDLTHDLFPSHLYITKVCLSYNSISFLENFYTSDTSSVTSSSVTGIPTNTVDHMRMRMLCGSKTNDYQNLPKIIRYSDIQ
jgi:phosphoglycerol transferase MdoB-like AlkP superfamily enzyme